ncbi:hypothetical protein BIW11_04040 [Tropilaelaps mercedesae]|uniref:FERM domain-containing protein n=1 Tax=Tropilaelaps mercedesae TaxID=418985 RepID=A0A1V9XC11_9ACAR|nr:hypothetical protein BIW11_04040 [Tropilaelaps mercedesae]
MVYRLGLFFNDPFGLLLVSSELKPCDSGWMPR